VKGHRHSVISADGTRIGLLTAGEGPALLLVHGGMGCIESWQPIWDMLTRRWRVTAMDRRGRGTSGDTEPYHIGKEYQDVAAVAASMAGSGDGPVDVFAHSFGATCVLGAAADGMPARRLALYEPPGPQATSREWRDRVSAMIADGRPGRAMVSFLTEIIRLTGEEVNALRQAPRDYDVLSIVKATMPREGQALATVDLKSQAAAIRVPVLLIRGSASPAWARDITDDLAAVLPESTQAVLPRVGHDAIDGAPELLVSRLAEFLR
jgi:pimeloyl-ACP methyl ester carboxylesterase